MNDKADTPQPAATLAEFYRGLLAELGCRSSIDEEGDVIIRDESGTYCIPIFEDDEEYFQLTYPNFWPIESEEDREQAKAACMEVTKNQKAAKLFLSRNGGDVTATTDAFFASRHEIKAIFPRYIQSIKSAVAAFRQAVGGEEGSEER
jgi:hypothetical protein